MAADGTRIAALAALALSLSACSSTGGEPKSPPKYPTPVQAANLLQCHDDEVALCMQTNCELDEYYCTDREDARKLFKAGEFRYD